MTSSHHSLSHWLRDSTYLVDSHDQVILSWVVEHGCRHACLLICRATVAFIENELTNLAQVHEKCRLVIELILEVVGEPGAIPGHDVKVYGTQAVLFRA